MNVWRHLGSEWYAEQMPICGTLGLYYPQNNQEEHNISDNE